MYISSFIFLGSSFVVLVMGLRRCYSRDKYDGEMRRLWEIRDDPFLFENIDIKVDDVNKDFYEKHHDVVEELHRDFRFVNYVDQNIPKVIRNLSLN